MTSSFSAPFSLSAFPLHCPTVSCGPEWQLALGKPVRWRAWRPTLSLLSDLAEHATALHRFGAAPRGQRGQVSLVWLFGGLTFRDLIGDAWIPLQVHQLNESGLLPRLGNFAQSECTTSYFVKLVNDYLIL